MAMRDASVIGNKMFGPSPVQAQSGDKLRQDFWISGTILAHA
jgi:hypothetical protein